MARRSGSRRKSSTGTIKLDIHRRTLRNGLKLMAVRTHSAPTLSLICSVEVSQMHEPLDKSGIVHVLGETMDEGTERYSGDELAELVEGYGGYLQTGGSGTSVQMASEDRRLAVRILGEVTMRPTFPAAGIRRAKQLTIADIKADRDEPRTVAGQLFKALVYGMHPYGRPYKGTIESVAGITPAQIRSVYRKWYTPNNARIVAVGDVDPDEILDLLSRTFRSWKGASPPKPEVASSVEPDKPMHEHVPQDRAQVQVYLGHLGVTRSDPDFYGLMVMDHVLGTGPGFTSRIARKLRDEQGLCYAVGAGITGSAGKERGTFTAYIGTSPGQEEQAIRGMLNEIRRIREEPASHRELADVKAYLTGSFVWGLERNSQLAGFLLRVDRFNLGDDYIERSPQLINAVTAKEVREVAERHLHPDRYHLVTLGPIDEKVAARLTDL